MIFLVKLKTVQTVQNDQVDELGVVKSKRKTWRPSARAVSIMGIVAVTVEEDEDVVVIGVEVTVVMVNLVCEVDVVDIVVDAVNLRQSRNSYSHLIPDFDVFLYGVSKWWLLLFDFLDKKSAFLSSHSLLLHTNFRGACIPSFHGWSIFGVLNQ
jgi:hypothetical protein